MIRFFLGTLVLSAILIGVGWFPTINLAGEGAQRDLCMACALSLVASWISVVPVVLSQDSDGKISPLPILGSMVIRFAIVAILGLAIVLAGWVDKAPFLIWVGISYMALLVADTVFVVKKLSFGVSATGGNEPDSTSPGESEPSKIEETAA